jgi:YhcN/YlaJ family sporulation lipoprotein
VNTLKTKRIITVICLLLIISLVAGCTLPFRRPEPQRQPEPTPTPEPQTPAPRTQPAPGQPGPDVMEMANRVADIATDVPGVDDAVVVVISNLALVGITLNREERAGNEVEVKRQVAERIEDREPSIVNAYVSANPDIIRQLKEISRGVTKGEPISGFFDQLTEVLQRMRAEDSQN